MKKILLTGGTGFIGSNLLKTLNAIGEEEIFVFDSMAPAKVKNINKSKFFDYLDHRELLTFASHKSLIKDFDLIVHLGATSSTVCTDKQILENNYQLTKDLISIAIENKIPIIYASSMSVYGLTQTPENQGTIEPLNMYAMSKSLTDNIVLRALAQDVHKVLPMIVGLRFANVYGPQESHKGPQASVIYNWYQQFKKKGWWDIFEGINQRDFVHVNDIVKCILWFMNNIDSKKSGIYDLGTGSTSDFANVSNIMMDHLHSNEKPKVVPIPDSLKGQYQTFTRADLAPLRAIGYDEPFTDLKTGVASYVDYLKENK